MNRIIAIRSNTTFIRTARSRFSTSAPESSAPVSTVTVKRGSTFFERLSSFLAGCGVGFGISTYFIYNELVESNEQLERSIKKIAEENSST